MAWMSRKKYCEREGIKFGAFKKRKHKGLVQWRYGGSGRGGEAGKHIEVWGDEAAQDSKPKAESEKAEILRSAQDDKPINSNAKDRYRVNRGEPGCRVVTHLRNGVPVIGEEAQSSKLKAENQTPNLPAIYNDTKRVPERCNLPMPTQGFGKASRIGNLKFALLQKFNEELTKEDPNLPLFKNGNGNGNHSKTKKIQNLLDLYNSGLLLPDIHQELKSISRATLYNWWQIYQQGGIDGLVPQFGRNGISKITPAEILFLRKKLLTQNKPTIGDSINKCKYLLGDESPSSPATLRRWVNQFRKENYDLWVLEREGEKALNDKCVPYAEREWRDLAVGDAVVADGHKLNFQVINPFTGKPTRAVMVLFWDWKSAYPLGWEIMLTENIQCVMAALRNAIITLGKFPTHALLDNGKAFRANIFTKKFRFQETEVPGIFDRLGITPHFAMPYNAQAKPIERFFRTFNDWFERESDAYIGSSIADKPPRLNRHEERARDLCNDQVLTIPETMDQIYRWREYYADQELKARDYARPGDIFEAEKGPGVDPFALHFLMMTCKARMVHRNGITFNGWHWYHESLYGLKDYVLMYYSYYDLSQVYVFYKDEFLCVAKPVEKLNPFAADSEFPEDMVKVNQIQSLKRRAIRQSKQLADTLRSNRHLQIDWNKRFRDNPEVAGAIEKIEAGKKPKVINISQYAASLEPEAPAEEERPLQFPSAWARYEFHLNGGVFKGPELDQKFMDDYRSGKIAPGEWEANYGKKTNVRDVILNAGEDSGKAGSCTF